MQLSAVGPTRVESIVYSADKGDGVRASYKHNFTRPPRLRVRGQRLVVDGVTVKADRDKGQRTTGWLYNPPTRKRRTTRNPIGASVDFSARGQDRGQYLAYGGDEISFMVRKPESVRDVSRGHLADYARKIRTAARRHRSNGRPSPAQLRARAAFVKMVRARAAGRKRIKKHESARRPSLASMRRRMRMGRAPWRGLESNPYEVTQAGRPTRYFGTSGQAISHVRAERRRGASPSARFVARNPYIVRWRGSEGKRQRQDFDKAADAYRFQRIHDSTTYGRPARVSYVPKSRIRSRALYMKRAAKIPGISKWSMFAGGTSAAEGKHGYEYRSPKKTYSISPFTTKYGRHAGYLLRVWPSKHHGHAGILPDGSEDYTLSASYRSPQAAVAAVKKHATQSNPRKSSRTSRRRVSRRIRANPPKGGLMARRRGRKRTSAARRRRRSHSPRRSHRRGRARRRISRRRRNSPVRHRRRSHRRRRSSSRRAHRSNPPKHRRRRSRRRSRRSHRRVARRNPIARVAGGIKRLLKPGMYLALGIGALYGVPWLLDKVSFLDAYPRVKAAAPMILGAGLVFAGKMFSGSWLLGLLLGGPLLLIHGWKFVQSLMGGRTMGVSSMATTPAASEPSGKGVGEYVSEEEALMLPAGTMVRDATTGEEFTVGDAYVGADPNTVGAFPLATIGGFPLSLSN